MEGMADLDENLIDLSEKDQFTLEQEEWLFQWNRIDSECFQTHQFEESEIMRLNKKLLKLKEIQRQRFKDLQTEKENSTLLREDFEKLVFRFQHTKCQNDNLIIERDTKLLQLEDAEAKYKVLQAELNEQSASMQTISRDFELKLSQNEDSRRQLVFEMRQQDANYANQLKQLEDKTKECMELQKDLESEREDRTCPICFLPYEESGRHRLVSLLCGHLFGDSCVRDHLERSYYCPICRASANNSNLIYIYGRRVIQNNRQ